MNNIFNRDLSGESLFNLILRIKESFLRRFRGFIYTLFFSFHKDSGLFVYLGRGARFINTKSILINNEVNIGSFARIECFYSKSNIPKLIIGFNTSFGDHLHIGVINQIIIGDNVLVGSKVLIIDHDHGYGGKVLYQYKDVSPKNRALISKGPILIENNVWIGEGAIILANSILREGCIIAAGSVVVNCEVKAFTVYKN
ncbi:acyltransferase [Aquirufa sp. HETE-40SA]